MRRGAYGAVVCVVDIFVGRTAPTRRRSDRLAASRLGDRCAARRSRSDARLAAQGLEPRDLGAAAISTRARPVAWARRSRPTASRVDVDLPQIRVPLQGADRDQRRDAVAHRGPSCLVDPPRMSPAANTPGTDVANMPSARTNPSCPAPPRRRASRVRVETDEHERGPRLYVAPRRLASSRHPSAPSRPCSPSTELRDLVSAP